MPLDIRTLFIFSVPLFGAFAVTTFYLWRSHKDLARGVELWSLAFALHSAAGVLFAFRHVLPDIFSIIAANGLTILGYVLFFDGTALFAGKRPRRYPNYIVLAAVILLFVYFTLIQVNLSARIVIITLAIALVQFNTALLAYSCRNGDNREIYLLNTFIFSALGSLNFIRFPITLLVDPGSDFMRSNIYQSFYILVYVFGGVLIAIGLNLLVNSRLSSIQLKAKISLAESETRFKQLSEATFEGIVIHDMGKVLDCNEMVLGMFRYPREEALNENVIRFIAPDYRAMVQKRFSERDREPYEAVCLRKDQTTFHAEIRARSAQYKGTSVRVVAIRDITDRKETEKALRQTLREKETLLKEIHHRVKNNMQTIASLLTLQARDESDDKVHRFVSESKARIHTMAMIHEMIYSSESLAEVEFGSYMEKLIEKIRTALVLDPGRIAVKVDAMQLVLTLDQAIPCALSITELLSNAIEHAFPCDRSGEIIIQVELLENEEVRISVSDNGVGIPEGDETALKAASLGLSLVDSLVGDQLEGSFQQEAVSNGTRFIIKFKRVL